MSTTAASSHEQPLLRFLTRIAGFFTLVLVIACLSWGRAILVPVALALLLSFLLQPVVARFQTIGLNRTIAVLLVVLVAGIACMSIGWILVTQVGNLSYDLRHHPAYRQHISEKLDDLRGIGQGGMLANLQATINDIWGEVTEEVGPAAPPSPPRVIVEEETSPLSLLGSALQPLLEPLGAAALVIVLVIFMLLKYEDLRNRLIGLLGSGQVTVTTKALEDAGQRISRYLLMQFIINFTYGTALALALFLLGVPYAMLWGFLAAVLRYVPYVGPWVAAIFPITISLVAFPGWMWPGAVISLFVVLELLSNLVMEPWLYGQSAGVSEVGLLVVTGFWTWLWGPIGLVLATPLTVCLIVLGRHVPQLQFFHLLLGDQPALAPHVLYYQRLLARDQEEAADLIEQYLQDHPQDTVYDELLIPALLLAREDRKAEVLDSAGEAFVLQATHELVEDLEMALPREAPGGDTAPAATHLESGTEPLLILGCPAHHEAEEVIIHMLAKLLHPHGGVVETVSTRTHASDVAALIRQQAPVLVYIAALPGGLPQTRYLCKSLRNEFATLPIVVGYWGSKEEFDKLLTRLRQAGATNLVTSLQQSRSRILALLEEASQKPPICEQGRRVNEA